MVHRVSHTADRDSHLVTFLLIAHQQIHGMHFIEPCCILTAVNVFFYTVGFCIGQSSNIAPDTIRYDTIEEINVDSKAEYTA